MAFSETFKPKITCKRKRGGGKNIRGWVTKMGGHPAPFAA